MLHDCNLGCFPVYNITILFTINITTHVFSSSITRLKHPEGSSSERLTQGALWWPQRLSSPVKSGESHNQTCRPAAQRGCVGLNHKWQVNGEGGGGSAPKSTKRSSEADN